MTTKHTAKQYVSILSVAFGSLLFPSSRLFQKYLGNLSVLIYWLIGLVLFYFFVRYQENILNLVNRIPERYINVLAIATLILLIAVVAVMYPIANSGRFGTGSDSDDSVNVAADELIHGRYPYYPLLYTGNHISQFPGSILLAVPFVALFGHSAYQNVFWVVIFFFMLRSLMKGNTRLSLLLIWVTLLLAPVFIYHLMIGPDYITNILVILCSSVWMIQHIPNDESPVWKKILPAILLGIGLSSRLNFFYITPLLFSLLLQKAGIKKAVLYCGIAAVMFIAVTAPFYLFDPAGFTPLQIQDKFAKYNYIIPYVSTLIPVSTGIVAVYFAIKQSRTLESFLRNSMWLIIIPLAEAVILSIIDQSPKTMWYSIYGTLGTFFGMTAIWLQLYGTPKTNDMVPD